MIRRLVLMAISCAGLAPALFTQVAPGYRMYGPHGSTDAYLIDNTGAVIHTWPSGGEPGTGMYLDTDGTLVRCIRVLGIGIGGNGGQVQRIAFDGTLLWDFVMADADRWQHHDIEWLCGPDGTHDGPV